MDPVSLTGLTLAVLTTFKELYLLTKFIAGTIRSARNSVRERSDLAQEFEIEFLYLRSLGQLFFQNDGIMRDGELNQEWLLQIYQILERLRIFCGDYAKIAAEQDTDYQAYSPYLNVSTSTSEIIEFSFDLHSQGSAAVENSQISKTRIFKWWSTKSTLDTTSLKWAIFGRKKFEALLLKFKKWNGKLKELLPIILADHQRYKDAATLGHLATDSNARRLGLVSHARLKQLTLSPASDSTDFDLHNRLLNVTSEISGVSLGQLSTSSYFGGKQEEVLVEYKSYDPEASSDYKIKMKSHIQQLASLLSSSGQEDLRTLPFRGYIEEKASSRFAFVFSLPRELVPSSNVRPLSLNSLIAENSTQSRFTLSKRFRVAKSVAKSLSAFHVDGWVHKSIRSHSVMFFKQAEDQPSREGDEDPYLVDFEFARPQTAETQYTFETSIERNLYRHPDRQGVPTVTFSKLHDVYALGVVLLEIGIWQTALTVYEEACAQLKKGTTISPRGIQKLFIEVGKRRLPHHMGEGYLQGVLACLTGELVSANGEGDFSMMFFSRVLQAIDIKKLA